VTLSLRKTLPSERLFRSLGIADLRAQFLDALTRNDGVTGAHCIHESWMRGLPPDETEVALGQLWAHAAATIPHWLPMHFVPGLPLVYGVAARFRASRRGRHNIYLISLDFSDRRGNPQGIYVGMTTYDPAQRFDQHRAGLRAAGSVLKRGRELLSGPVLHLQRIGRPDAVRIERELASAFEDAGFVVEGGH
jgi:predicted GIY-YIG superfamily endonuclease